jgi:hypothetical protein
MVADISSVENEFLSCIFVSRIASVLRVIPMNNRNNFVQNRRKKYTAAAAAAAAAAVVSPRPTPLRQSDEDDD